MIRVYMHWLVQLQIHMYPVEILKDIYVLAKSAITARSFRVLSEKDKQLSVAQQCVFVFLTYWKTWFSSRFANFT